MEGRRRVNTPLPPETGRLVLLLASAGPAGALAAVSVRRLIHGRPATAPAAGPAPLIAALAAAFAWVAERGPSDWPLILASLALAWGLVCLAAIDLATHRLPDAITLPLLGGGLGVSLLLPGRPWLDHAAGAAIAAATQTGRAWSFRRLRGRDAIGGGDAKLFGAAGAWLGWAALPSVMIIACLAAFLWIGARVLRRGPAASGERIAFGAPLCLAILTVWLEGPLSIGS